MSILTEITQHCTDSASGEATALVYFDPGAQRSSSLTYRQLWTVSCRVAHRLRTALAETDDAERARVAFLRERGHAFDNQRVGIMVDEGLYLYPLELACLLAGFVLVPVHPDTPPAKLAALCSDAVFSAVVVADEQQASRVREATTAAALSLAVQTLRMGDLPFQDDHPSLHQQRCSSLQANLPLSSALRPEAVSHVWPTSGSTGAAKLCVSTHGALAAYCRAKVRTQRIAAALSSVVFVASPHTFDPSLTDALSTWAAGAALATAPRAAIFADLRLCLEQTRATHVCTTPSMLATAISGGGGAPSSLPDTLRLISLGGEVAPVWLLKHLRAAASTTRVAVVYGTTEAIAYQSFSDVTDERPEDVVGLLGTPLPGLVFAVQLDGDDAEQKGELFVGGAQVTLLGYLNDRALTASKFLAALPPHDDEAKTLFVRSDDEDASLTSTGSGCCWYRTGDYVRVGSDGRLFFAGRKDGQIKLNGRRVELGEIETNVVQGSASLLVERCVALVRSVGDSAAVGGGGARQQLVCVAIPSSELQADIDALPTADEQEPHRCRRQLLRVAERCALFLARRRLPRDLMPARIHLLSTPAERDFLLKGCVTRASGKIDRAALSAWLDEREKSEAAANGGGGALDEDDGDPVAVDESAPTFAAVVAVAWGETLGIQPSQIRTRSRFDLLGGDSLAALRCVRRVRNGLGPDAAGVGASPLGADFGSLAPIELLKRPVFSDYVRWLRQQLEADGRMPALLVENEQRSASGAATQVPQQSAEADDGYSELVAACRAGLASAVHALLEVANAPLIAPDSVAAATTPTALLALCANAPNEAAPEASAEGAATAAASAAAAASTTPFGAVAKLLLAHAARTNQTEQLLLTGLTDTKIARDAAVLFKEDNIPVSTLAQHVAAARGATSVLEAILAAGAGCGISPGAKNVDRQTVLHCAVRSAGNPGTVLLALRAVKGCKARAGGREQRDKWQRTAAAWALALGRDDLLELFAREGCPLTAVETAVAEAAASDRRDWRESGLVFKRGGEKIANHKRTLGDAALQALVRKLDLIVQIEQQQQEGDAQPNDLMQQVDQTCATLREVFCANQAHRAAAAGPTNAAAALLRVIRSPAASDFAVAQAITALRNLCNWPECLQQALAADGAEILAAAIRSRRAKHGDEAQCGGEAPIAEMGVINTAAAAAAAGGAEEDDDGDNANGGGETGKAGAAAPLQWKQVCHAAVGALMRLSPTAEERQRFIERFPDLKKQLLGYEGARQKEDQ